MKLNWLSLFICPTFINILAKKIFAVITLSSKSWKIFRQSWTKYLKKKHIFKLPSLPPIQCCPKERKFAGLIDTEVANTHKQHWKCGRGGFSQNILSTIISDYIWFQVTVANRITIRFWIAGASRVALWSRITISIGNTNLISNYC